MIQSLFIKLGMLALTMGVVLWIGWRAPQVAIRPSALVDGSEIPLAPHSVASESETKDRANASPTSAEARVVKSPVSVDGTARRRLLDLNQAGPDDFESLPGIGPVLAQRIVVYRKSNGGFHTVEELRQVKGIGRKKFDRVRPLVTVTAPNTKGRTEKRLS